MSIFSAVILDANPLAFEPAPVYHNPENVSSQQIPPHSKWASMVEGALEYCRLAYSLCPKETGSVALTVAEKKPRKIPGSYNALPHIQQGLASVRQREPNNGNSDAVSSALVKAMESVSPRTHQFHLIILLMQTQSDEENTFLYRDTHGGQSNDMRYAALEAHRKIAMKQLDNIVVDVLRISDTNELLPTLSESLSDSLHIRVHSVPCTRIKDAMIHMAQSNLNINLLCIENIPMNVRSGSAEKVAKTVPVYYGADDEIDTRDSKDDVPLLHPEFALWRQKHVNYVKRSKRLTVEDTSFRPCAHRVTPVDAHDAACVVFLDMIQGGSIAYLQKPALQGSQSPESYTHVLMNIGGRGTMRCLKSSQVKEELKVKEEVKEELHMPSLDDIPIKLEGSTKPNRQRNEDLEKRLCVAVLDASTYDNVAAFLADGRMAQVPYPSRLVPDTQKFSADASIDKTSRWLKCMLEAQGTDRFLPNPSSPIRELADMMQSGNPIGTGLDYPQHIMESPSSSLCQLKTSLMAPTVRSIDTTFGQVEQLVSDLMNMRKQGDSMLATKLLTAIYLVGLQFKHYSTTHKQVCKKIHDTINAAEAAELKRTEEAHHAAEAAAASAALPAYDVEDAFIQLNRYQNMSHRERADAQHAVPSMRGRGRRGGGQGTNFTRTSVNPNFNKRQRIGSDKEAAADNKREDDGSEYMEVLKPYLEYKRPTVEERKKKAAEDRQMWGPPGSLMWLDKMRERQAWRGTYQDDFGEKTAYEMKGHWHYGQREFTGCLPENEGG